MDSIDALGRRPERIAAFTGSLLSETEDEELKAIVEEAARGLSTPIALVNLVLEQIQFFKAHHGLPEDLAAARGTDRDVSFCQFVVREGEPFEVVDAENDERVPKHLVKYYGIRSYLGMPIIANETIVGSLCVIDTKPREFTEEERHNLKKLASLVNARLGALAERRDGHPGSGRKKQELAPALAELHKAIGPIREEVLSGRIATTAIGAFLRLMDHALGSEAVPVPVIEQTLHAAREALANSRDRFYDIDVSADYAQSSLSVLENILNLSSSTRLATLVQGALELSAPGLEAVGGFSLSDDSGEVTVSTPRPLGVSILSTCLSLIGIQMARHELTSGIKVAIKMVNGQPAVLLKAEKLPPQAMQEILEKLAKHLGEGPTLALQLADGALQALFAISSQDSGSGPL